MRDVPSSSSTVKFFLNYMAVIAIVAFAIGVALSMITGCSSPSFDVVSGFDPLPDTAPETAAERADIYPVDTGYLPGDTRSTEATSEVAAETNAETSDLPDTISPPDSTPPSDSGTTPADTTPEAEACDATPAPGGDGTCYPQGTRAECSAPCGLYAYKCLGAGETPPDVAGCTVMPGSPVGWLCCTENRCVRTASTDYVCLSKFDDAGSHAPPHNYQCPPGPTPAGCVDVGAAGYCCP